MSESQHFFLKFVKQYLSLDFKVEKPIRVDKFYFFSWKNIHTSKRFFFLKEIYLTGGIQVGIFLKDGISSGSIGLPTLRQTIVDEMPHGPGRSRQGHVIFVYFFFKVTVGRNWWDKFVFIFFSTQVEIGAAKFQIKKSKHENGCSKSINHTIILLWP